MEVFKRTIYHSLVKNQVNVFYCFQSDVMPLDFLMTISYLIYSHSCSAYKALMRQEVLCLPSVRTLQRLVGKFQPDNENIKSYLKTKVSKLNDHEKLVSLSFDEIYIYQHVDYTSGKLSGLTDENELASTQSFVSDALQRRCKKIFASFSSRK